MKTCAYKFRNGEKCREETWQNSEFCIIHIELPEDEESGEFKRINELKDKKVEEKLIQKEFNFEGAKLFEVDFSGMKIKNTLDFSHAIIRKDALFEGAMIGGDALFEGAMIGGDALFEGATIGRDARFGEATILGDALFGRARIGRYALFGRAKIGKIVNFDLTEIKGTLSFKDTTFENPESQEHACRKAKNIWAKLGDRVEENYHHYSEMEAKRKQKNPIIKFLELPIQYIFGYGTKIKPTFIIWFLIVSVSVLSFWIGNGIYQLVSYILAIIAAIMGALFVTIFARRYMR
ncbi:pentapeptide repeat-containing protein [Halobacteriota archaeon]